MPPHSPFDASPIGRLIPPGIPIVRTGTCGKSLANRNPEVLGRNPWTARPTMAPSAQPASTRGCSAVRSIVASVRNSAT